MMRSAGSLGSASLVPREVELFSRYSPSPLSMKQLLDFGERGSRAGGWRWGWGSALILGPQVRRSGFQAKTSPALQGRLSDKLGVQAKAACSPAATGWLQFTLSVLFAWILES